MYDDTQNSNVQNFERYSSDGTKKEEKKSRKGGKKFGVVFGLLIVTYSFHLTF